MNTRQNLVSLVIVVALAIYCTWYLDSLKPRSIEGMARYRMDCGLTPQADLLTWTLPRTAHQIRYWVMPHNRYYEATFRIEKKHFEDWLDEIQGGEVDSLGVVVNEPLKREYVNRVIPIPGSGGIDFRLISKKNNSIHVVEGEWLPPITTSKFREFSAIFDSRHKLAYVYFFR